MVARVVDEPQSVVDEGRSKRPVFASQVGVVAKVATGRESESGTPPRAYLAIR